MQSYDISMAVQRIRNRFGAILSTNSRDFQQA
jgi:hypothetical protein